MNLDIDLTKQMAIDVNNVAEASFQSGKEHIEKPLLAQIKKLEVENAELNKDLDLHDNIVATYNSEVAGLEEDFRRLMFLPTDIVNENKRLKKITNTS